MLITNRKPTLYTQRSAHSPPRAARLGNDGRGCGLCGQGASLSGGSRGGTRADGERQ
ncbi:hypothetical protein JB92DRAFT_2864276 [Gautieria morchelliformis]|nr:hypothetical protein JB92DRAFT_2864276 [Gautieria morchelliformis]